jgi:hypothetical protein
MKTVLIAAAALAAGASVVAGPVSSADSIRDEPLPEPAFPHDIRVRAPHGGLFPYLQQPPPENDGPAKIEAPDLRALPPRNVAPPPVFNPRPFTLRGDGEVYALHGKRGPQILPMAPMPMVAGDGTEIDPKLPMKTPDPSVDYKLHVRQVPPPATDDAKK